MYKICIARRLVVDIFPWCNTNFVLFPIGTLVASWMGNGRIDVETKFNIRFESSCSKHHFPQIVNEFKLVGMNVEKRTKPSNCLCFSKIRWITTLFVFECYIVKVANYLPFFNKWKCRLDAHFPTNVAFAHAGDVRSSCDTDHTKATLYYLFVALVWLMSLHVTWWSHASACAELGVGKIYYFFYYHNEIMTLKIIMKIHFYAENPLNKRKE